MGYESLRRDDLAAALDARVDDTVDGSSAFLAATFAEAAYPTLPGSVYALHPIDCGGAEVEGAAPVLSVDGDRTFYAFNLGSAVPAAGTTVLTHAAGGRYVFRHDG